VNIVKPLVVGPCYSTLWNKSKILVFVGKQKCEFATARLQLSMFVPSTVQPLPGVLRSGSAIV